MSTPWQPHEWEKQSWDGWQTASGWHETARWKHNGSEDPVGCRDWNDPVSCRDWKDPVSCRDGDHSSSARGSQDNLTGRLAKWDWVTPTDQPADSHMNEAFKNNYGNWHQYNNWNKNNQAPPQANPKAVPKAAQSRNEKQGAPEAARRWLSGLTQKSETGVCERAAATSRAEAHEFNFSSPCVKGVSCGDTLEGHDVEFFLSFEVRRHWKDHNCCLKWFRELAEGKIHVDMAIDGPVIFLNDLDDEGDLFLPLVRPAGGGTDFSFDVGGDFVPWRWQGMVAHIT